jgi:hypothetical protein
MMKDHAAVAVLAFAAGGLSGWLAARAGAQGTAASPPAAAPQPAWIRGSADERAVQIENHLRGLDVAMVEIGYATRSCTSRSRTGTGTTRTTSSERWSWRSSSPSSAGRSEHGLRACS